MNPSLKQQFADNGFLVELTKDGSPTLRSLDSGESMHHFDSAAGETWYVYGQIIQAAIKNLAATDILKVCSIGLGLGYVEMVWALLLKNCKHLEIRSDLDSFEKSLFLRQVFCDWIQSHELRDEFELQQKTSAALSFVCNLTGPIRDCLNHEVADGHFKIHGDIKEFQQLKKWNIICFDAFSKKTNAEIWQIDFLQNFLIKHAEVDCVFTTYAATSELKKILINQNFTLIKRLGFSGKRECSLAVRGRFKAGFALFQTS